MAIKVILLKSGETLISDIRELVGESEEEQKQIYGYVLSSPKKISINTPLFLQKDEEVDDSSIQVSLSPWILLTKDENVPIPTNWVVTIVEPIDRLKEMYEKQLEDGKAN